MKNNNKKIIRSNVKKLVDKRTPLDVASQVNREKKLAGPNRPST